METPSGKTSVPNEIEQREEIVEKELQYMEKLKENKSDFFFLSFILLGLHLQHMEVPRLGVRLELQLWAYTTAAATQDP